MIEIEGNIYKRMLMNNCYLSIQSYIIHICMYPGVVCPCTEEGCHMYLSHSKVSRSTFHSRFVFMYIKGMWLCHERLS